MECQEGLILYCGVGRCWGWDAGRGWMGQRLVFRYHFGYEDGLTQADKDGSRSRDA